MLTILGPLQLLRKDYENQMEDSYLVRLLSGKLFVVMGASGAGRALAYGGKEKGTRVVVANRTYAKAKELARKVGGEAIPLSELEHFHPEEGMILANTTSIGMKPKIDETPIPKGEYSAKKGCNSDGETWEECLEDCNHICYKDPVLKDQQWSAYIDRSPGAACYSEVSAKLNLEGLGCKT